MKRAEIVLLSIFSLLWICKVFFGIKLGVSPLLTITGMTLSTFYCYFTFLLLNDIKLRRVFKKDSYAHTSALRIIVSIFMGISYGIFWIAVVFKTLHWPGAKVMMILPAIPLLIGLCISLFKLRSAIDARRSFYNKVAIRNVVLLVLILLSLTIRF
jgi:hypothetical protein